jgi:hypothetical protein
MYHHNVFIKDYSLVRMKHDSTEEQNNIDIRITLGLRYRQDDIDEIM